MVRFSIRAAATVASPTDLQVIGPENILTNSRITKIRHDGRRITAVKINGRENLAPERVISTLPPVQMLKLLNPAPPAPLDWQGVD